MLPPCIYKDYNIIKRVTLAYIVITIIGNYYMSFFGYSYFTINNEEICELVVISRNTLQSFISSLNDFVYKIIMQYKKHDDLKELVDSYYHKTNDL